MLAAAAQSAVEWHNADSLAGWNKIVGDTFGSTQVVATTREFSGHLERGVIGDLQIIRVRAQASMVQKRPPKDAAGTDGTILVHLQSSGTSLNCQESRYSRLASGEAVLCDPNRNYSVEFESAYEMFVLKFHTAHLAARFPDLDPKMETIRPLDAHRSKLLLAFLSAAWEQIDCLEDDPDWGDCINQTVFDLVVRSIVRSDGSRSGPPARRLQSEVMSYVRRHLSDPALRTSTIAAAVGVSGRSVQTIFEGMATTASAFILDERLRLAAERVRLGRQSITQIAMDLGFNDASYFSRCFHRHFGISPRAYARR